VGADEILRGDQSTAEAGRHDALRLRLGTGHRHNGALPAYVPDLLSAPQEFVREHEVITKGVALCAKIKKVALGVDGNEANRRCLLASGDAPKAGATTPTPKATRAATITLSRPNRFMIPPGSRAMRARNARGELREK
jgi:hypothetical protein